MNDNNEDRGISFTRRLRQLLNKIFPGIFPRQVVTDEEIRNVLLEGEKSGAVETEERSMVEGVFYLGDRPVSAFMSHRSEIIWLDIDADPMEVRKLIEEPESESQRCFPVVSSGDLDEVKGVVYIRDVYRALLSESWPGLGAIMKPPYFIPETMSALKVFEAFKKNNGMDVFVMDEYGGFAGIITVRDLIEEIVGDISPDPMGEEGIIKKEEGVWLADGSVSIDEAALVLELESLREEQNEYHTLAGFILYLAGEIPSMGAHFYYKDYRFTITEIDGNRIEKIIITKMNLKS